ncbi:MAG: hypothetical protein KGO94_01875 [Alphaproteobacteria bacterium]|nr:hypothetical protein [Alphaproteobacteria bacterium]
MASVIALADWPKSAKSRAAQEGDAEVLIFTGVRFERLRDEPLPVARTKRISRHNQATAEELE